MHVYKVCSMNGLAKKSKQNNMTAKIEYSLQ